MPNPHFVPSDPGFVDEDRWMGDVLGALDEKWKQKKLIWTNRPETVPSEFKRLARALTPSVLFWIQAFCIRKSLYGVNGPNKKDRELELYMSDTWS